MNGKNGTSRQKKKPHCAVCKVKLGLMLMVCRCSKVLCASHIQPELHDCASLQEFKDAERQRLEAQLMAPTRQNNNKCERI